MGSGGTFCPQKSFESTGSRRERAHPLDGCQESIACATSEHGSRRDGSRSGVALGFERATWARRRGRPVGRVRSAPSRRAGSIRPLAGAAARPAAAVVPAAASASASRANWLAFDERPSSQNPDCHLKPRSVAPPSRCPAAAPTAAPPAADGPAATATVGGRLPPTRTAALATAIRAAASPNAAADPPSRPPPLPPRRRCRPPGRLRPRHLPRRRPRDWPRRRHRHRPPHRPPLRSHRRRRAATPPLPPPLPSRRHRPSRRLCRPCRLGCPLFRGPRHRRRRRRPRRHRYRRLPPRHPLRHRHPPSLTPSRPASSVLAPTPTHHHRPPRAPTRRPRAPTPPPSPTSPSPTPTPRPRLFTAPLGASWRRRPNRCGPRGRRAARRRLPAGIALPAPAGGCGGARRAAGKLPAGGRRF